MLYILSYYVHDYHLQQPSQTATTASININTNSLPGSTVQLDMLAWS